MVVKNRILYIFDSIVRRETAAALVRNTHKIFKYIIYVIKMTQERVVFLVRTSL